MNGEFDKLNIRQAKTEEDFLGVWQLTHDQYVAKGYASPRPDGILRHYPQYDFIEETTVVIAESLYNEVVGTVSLTENGEKGLPLDKDFPDIISDIKDECVLQNKKLVAFWRLVISGEHCNELDIIMKLMSSMCYLLEDRKVDVLLLTVNPKHVGFYEHMGHMEQISDLRSAGAVKSAPAILMRGTTSRILRQWETVKNRRSSARINRTTWVAPNGCAFAEQ